MIDRGQPSVTKNPGFRRYLTSFAGALLSSAVVAISCSDSGFAQSSSAPAIMFGGQNIAGKTATVAAGQVVSVNSPTANSSYFEFIGPTQASDPAYGGYQEIRSPTCPTAPAPNTTSCITYLQSYVNNSPSQPVNVYFIQAGKWTVTYYTYTDASNSTQVSSQATFNVVAPTVQIKQNVGTVQFDNPSSPTKIELGGSGLGQEHNQGAVTYASAVQPAGFTGTFSWVQSIDTQFVSYTSQNGTKTINYNCPGASYVGLDDTDPYPLTGTDSTIANSFTNNLASDSPDAGFPASFTTYRTIFGALTELVWRPPTSKIATTVIPVVLGYANWSWSGIVDHNSQGALEIVSPNVTSSISQGGHQIQAWFGVYVPGSKLSCSST